MNSEIRNEMRRSLDLMLIVLFSLLLAAFIYLIPDSPVQIIISIPFIILFPGYSLIATLFPERKSIDTIERLALSLGLSIAVVALIGFGLNYTPFGIRLDPILWSLILFNSILSIFGISRRNASSEPFLPFSPGKVLEWSKGGLKGKGKSDKVITAIVAIAVLSSVLALAYAVAVPKEAEPFTDFYVLGVGGSAVDYPHDIAANESATVLVGIANHEQKTVNYTLEVWLANETFSDNVTVVNNLYYLDGYTIVLDSVPAATDGNWTKEWQEPYTFSFPVAGSYKIWFVLQVDGVSFQGVKNQDYAGTAAQDRFISMVGSNDDQSLNLNINIAG